MERFVSSQEVCVLVIVEAVGVDDVVFDRLCQHSFCW